MTIEDPVIRQFELPQEYSPPGVAQIPEGTNVAFTPKTTPAFNEPERVNMGLFTGIKWQQPPSQQEFFSLPEFKNGTPETRLNMLATYRENSYQFAVQHGVPKEQARKQTQDFFEANRWHALDNKIAPWDSASNEILNEINRGAYAFTGGVGKALSPNATSYEADKERFEYYSENGLPDQMQRHIAANYVLQTTQEEKEAYKDYWKTVHNVEILDGPDGTVFANAIKPDFASQPGDENEATTGFNLGTPIELAGQLISEGSKWAGVKAQFETNPALHNTFLFGHAPRMVGGAVPWAAATMVGGTPALLTMAAGSQMEEAFISGVAQHATGKQVIQQMGVQGLMAAATAGGFSKAGAWLKQTPFGQDLSRAVGAHIIGGSTMGAWMGVNQTLTNMAEKYGGIDPGRNIFAGTPEAIVNGYLFGGVSETVHQAQSPAEARVVAKTQLAANRVLIDTAHDVIDGTHPEILRLQLQANTHPDAETRAYSQMHVELAKARAQRMLEGAKERNAELVNDPVAREVLTGSSEVTETPVEVLPPKQYQENLQREVDELLLPAVIPPAPEPGTELAIRQPNEIGPVEPPPTYSRIPQPAGLLPGGAAGEKAILANGITNLSKGGAGREAIRAAYTRIWLPTYYRHLKTLVMGGADKGESELAMPGEESLANKWYGVLVKDNILDGVKREVTKLEELHSRRAELESLTQQASTLGKQAKESRSAANKIRVENFPEWQQAKEYDAEAAKLKDQAARSGAERKSELLADADRLEQIAAMADAKGFNSGRRRDQLRGDTATAKAEYEELKIRHTEINEENSPKWAEADKLDEVADKIRGSIPAGEIAKLRAQADAMTKDARDVLAKTKSEAKRAKAQEKLKEADKLNARADELGAEEGTAQQYEDEATKLRREAEAEAREQRVPLRQKMAQIREDLYHPSRRYYRQADSYRDLAANKRQMAGDFGPEAKAEAKRIAKQFKLDAEDLRNTARDRAKAEQEPHFDREQDLLKQQSDVVRFLDRNRPGVIERKLEKQAEHVEWLKKHHNTQALAREVLSMRGDTEFLKFVERWKRFVNSEMDRDYGELKGLDPATDFEGRGVVFGARVNLLPDFKAKEMVDRAEKAKAAGYGEGGAPGDGNLQNVNVPRDPFNREAKFTGTYDMDMERGLENTFRARKIAIDRQRLYLRIQELGLGRIETNETGAVPHELNGEELFPLAFRVNRTSKVGRPVAENATLWTTKRIIRELDGVLNTEHRIDPDGIAGRILRGATSLQLAQTADAFTHLKNQQTRVVKAMMQDPGLKSVFMKVPGLSTVLGLENIFRTVTQVREMGPEMQVKIAEMARDGMYRPPFSFEGKLTKIPVLRQGQQVLRAIGHFLHECDTASRVISFDIANRLIAAGEMENTPLARRNYVQRLGEYNRLLSNKVERILKDSIISPFFSAGKAFNLAGVEWLTLNPGFKATSTKAALKARANIASGVVLAAVMPALLNLMTTGSLVGRSGTKIGAWDLGPGMDDEEGRRKSIDFLQLLGIRRGLRITGAEAALEGGRSGETLAEIADKAEDDIATGFLHPYMGPGVSAAFQIQTGKQLSFRSGREFIETRRVQGGGQKLENLRVGLKEQNAILYGLGSLISEDVFPPEVGRSGAAEFGAGFTSSFGSAFGYKEFRSAAEQKAGSLANSSQMTTEQDSRWRIKTEIRKLAKQDPVAAEQMLDAAYDEGDLAQADLRQMDSYGIRSTYLEGKGAKDTTIEDNQSNLIRKTKRLSVHDALAVLRTAEKTDKGDAAKIREIVHSKIEKSTSLTEVEREALQALYEKLTGEAF